MSKNLPTGWKYFVQRNSHSKRQRAKTTWHKVPTCDPSNQDWLKSLFYRVKRIEYHQIEILLPCSDTALLGQRQGRLCHQVLPSLLQDIRHFAIHPSPLMRSRDA